MQFNHFCNEFWNSHNFKIYTRCWFLIFWVTFPLFLITVFPSKSICVLIVFSHAVHLALSGANQSMWAGFGSELYRNASKSWHPFRALGLVRKGPNGSFRLKVLSSAESAAYCLKALIITCQDPNSHLILHYLHMTGLILHSCVALFFLPYKCTIKSAYFPSWKCSWHEALIYVCVRETLEILELGHVEGTYRSTFFLSFPFLWWTVFCLDREPVWFMVMDATQRRKDTLNNVFLQLLSLFFYLI